jgi:ppGpp synthetase/RelA/SpoT-type nucleotidyltranferase
MLMVHVGVKNEGIREDITCTCFVVKYLDGVHTLITELSNLADECHVRKRHEWKSNDDGYYAVHFYVSHTVEVPVIVGGTRIITAWIELQITTQLQEVLRTFLHVIYEKRRMRRSPPPDIPW